MSLFWCSQCSPLWTVWKLLLAVQIHVVSECLVRTFGGEISRWRAVILARDYNRTFVRRLNRSSAICCLKRALIPINETRTGTRRPTMQQQCAPRSVTKMKPRTGQVYSRVFTAPIWQYKFISIHQTCTSLDCGKAHHGLGPSMGLAEATTLYNCITMRLILMIQRHQVPPRFLWPRRLRPDGAPESCCSLPTHPPIVTSLPHQPHHPKPHPHCLACDLLETGALGSRPDQMCFSSRFPVGSDSLKKNKKVKTCTLLLFKPV